MHKAIILCKRKEGISQAAFKDWFLGPHADSAIAAAGHFMNRYSMSFVVGPGPGAAPWPNGEPPYDAVSEFWVDDEAMFHETYRHLRGQGEMNQVVEHTSIRVPLMTEEVVVLDRMHE